MAHADPLSTGHVTSLARPGGNITGLSMLMTEITVKSVQLLKEAVPGLSRLAATFDPGTPSHGPILTAVEAAASTLGLHVQSVAVRSSADFDKAFSAMVREHAEAVLILLTPFMLAGVERLAELTMAHKLPSLFAFKQYAEAGGLMSYGPNRLALYRRGADYVDKLLKGAKPADLPVEQATRFDFVINMKTAKALGLTLSPALLAFASEFIE